MKTLGGVSLAIAGLFLVGCAEHPTREARSEVSMNVPVTTADGTRVPVQVVDRNVAESPAPVVTRNPSDREAYLAATDDRLRVLAGRLDRMRAAAAGHHKYPWVARLRRIEWVDGRLSDTRMEWELLGAEKTPAYESDRPGFQRHLNSLSSDVDHLAAE